MAFVTNSEWAPMDPDGGLDFIVGLVNGDSYRDLSTPGRLDTLIFHLSRWLGSRSDVVADSKLTPLNFATEVIDQLRERITALIDKGEFRVDKLVGRARAYRLPGDAVRTHTEMPRTHLVDARLLFTLEGRAANLRRCLKDECRKLYLASRKGQRYCSINCSNAEAARRHRQKTKTKVEVESAPRRRALR